MKLLNTNAKQSLNNLIITINFYYCRFSNKVLKPICLTITLKIMKGVFKLETNNYSMESMSSPTNAESVYQPNAMAESQQISANLQTQYHEVSTIILLILSLIGGQVIPSILAIVSLVKGLKGADVIKANKLTKIGWILYVLGVVFVVIMVFLYFAFIIENYDQIQNSIGVIQ